MQFKNFTLPIFLLTAGAIAIPTAEIEHAITTGTVTVKQRSYFLHSGWGNDKTAKAAEPTESSNTRKESAPDCYSLQNKWAADHGDDGLIVARQAC